MKDMDDVKVKVIVKLNNIGGVLCCPLPNMEVWSLHPRVYLQPNEEEEALCPYCSTTYVVGHD